MIFFKIFFAKLKGYLLLKLGRYRSVDFALFISFDLGKWFAKTLINLVKKIYIYDFSDILDKKGFGGCRKALSFC